MDINWEVVAAISIALNVACIDTISRTRRNIKRVLRDLGSKAKFDIIGRVDGHVK